MKELLARIRAMTRVQGLQTDKTLSFGNVTLDCSSYDLRGPGGSHKLAGKEYQMLEMLMRNPRTLVSTEAFMDRIWGYDSEAELNSVWVYISTLRKKLKSMLLIGAINVLNFRSLVRDADSTLEILSQNGGRFPGQMFRPEDQPAEMIPPPQSMQGPPQDPTAPPDREELPDTGRKGPFGDRRGGFGELAYQSRYFTASFDSEGNVTVNLDNLASLTEDEARTLAAAVYAQGREKGFADAYR